MKVDTDLAAWEGCWRDVFVSVSRRRFTVEYKVEAAHRVIDSGRTIAEVARELNVEFSAAIHPISHGSTQALKHR